MTWLMTLLRRSFWLVAIGAAGGAAYSWWRARSAPPSSSPPVWPPLDSAAPAAAASGSATAAPAGATSSVVNSLVDAPDARTSGNGDGSWVAPNDDGSCPVSHPIKANDNSGIFHVPGGQFYDRTRAERCYSTADAAEADGYRQAKA